MTTNTTPDDFTDASWLGALTSHTWLGDLADELGPELAQEFTDNHRCYYEHGHAGLRMPAGDLDGATRVVLRLVKTKRSLTSASRSARWAGRPMPSWSVRTERFSTYSDEHDRGHRHHSIGIGIGIGIDIDITVTCTAAIWFGEDIGETVEVHGCAREPEDGPITFFVNVGTGNDLRSFTTDDARQLATVLPSVADRVDDVARRQ